jgi:hypothetical protein
MKKDVLKFGAIGLVLALVVFGLARSPSLEVSAQGGTNTPTPTPAATATATPVATTVSTLTPQQQAQEGYLREEYKNDVVLYNTVARSLTTANDEETRANEEIAALTAAGLDATPVKNALSDLQNRISNAQTEFNLATAVLNQHNGLTADGLVLDIGDAQETLGKLEGYLTATQEALNPGMVPIEFVLQEYKAGSATVTAELAQLHNGTNFTSPNDVQHALTDQRDLRQYLAEYSQLSAQFNYDNSVIVDRVNEVINQLQAKGLTDVASALQTQLNAYQSQLSYASDQLSKANTALSQRNGFDVNGLVTNFDDADKTVGDANMWLSNAQAALQNAVTQMNSVWGLDRQMLK